MEHIGYHRIIPERLKKALGRIIFGKADISPKEVNKSRAATLSYPTDSEGRMIDYYDSIGHEQVHGDVPDLPEGWRDGK